MWQKKFLQIYAFLSLLAISQALQPATDARNYFATNFYRQLMYQSQLYTRNFIISPAAVQKLFTIIYNGADAQLADEILWDLQLKHVDEQRLFADALTAGLGGFTFAGALRDRQVAALNALIARESVLNYLDEDFKELLIEIDVQNYGIVPEYAKLNASFATFAKNYFNMLWLPRADLATMNVVHRVFGLNSARLGAANGIQLLSALKYNGSLAPLDVDEVAVYRYAELAYNGIATEALMQVLQLPLGQLQLLLFLHDDNAHLEHFLSQMLGRNVNDFQQLEGKLHYKFVRLALPDIKVEAEINLANYFVELGRAGLQRLFTENVALPRLFKGNSKNAFRFDNFWQKCSLTMYHNISSKPPSAAANFMNDMKQSANSKIFNAIGKPFFFVIKSEHVLYFMGHIVN